MTALAVNPNTRTAPSTRPSPSTTRDARALALFDEAREASPQRRHEIHDEIAVLYLEVARSIALRYRERGIPLDDLVQAANEGLVKAVARFDPALRHDFLSYAVPTMRGEVRRYFRDHGWTVRPPRRVQDLQWQRGKIIDALHQELGREPTRAEVAARLDVEEGEIEEADLAAGAFTPTSLDLPTGHDDDHGAPLGDLLPDDDRHDDDAAEARTMLQPVVRRLGERDRRVLFLRFFEDWTQKEIGEEIGVSQMQVSRTLTTMREELGPEAGAHLGHSA